MASSGTNTSTYIVPESTYGTTPSSPTMEALTLVSSSPTTKRGTNISETIRSDRQITSLIPGIIEGSLSLSGELAYTNADTLLQGCLCGTWAAKFSAETGTTISASASDNSFNDSGSGFPAWVAGDKLTVAGFSTGGNNGACTVVSATSSKVIVSGLTLANESAGSSITITTRSQILKSGTTRRSFSLLRVHNDLTGTGKYEMLTGVEINTMKIEIPLEGPVGISFDAVFKAPTFSADAPSGATFGSESNYKSIGTTTGASVLEGGSSALITKGSIALENGLSARKAVGEEYVIACAAIGKSNLSGDATFYFEDATLFNKFINSTASSMVFSFSDLDGNGYKLTLPNIAYTDPGAIESKAGSDEFVSMKFQALYDSTNASQIVIQKNPA